MFIPFETEGYSVYFENFTPIDDDINQYMHIVLTDGELQWDLTGVEMHCNRTYGGNAGRFQSVCCKNSLCDMSMDHKSDLVMGSISGSLVTDNCFERLMNLVGIKYPHFKTRARQKNGAYEGPRLV